MLDQSVEGCEQQNLAMYLLASLYVCLSALGFALFLHARLASLSSSSDIYSARSLFWVLWAAKSSCACLPVCFPACLHVCLSACLHICISVCLYKFFAHFTCL